MSGWRPLLALVALFVTDQQSPSCCPARALVEPTRSLHEPPQCKRGSGPAIQLLFVVCVNCWVVWGMSPRHGGEGCAPENGRGATGAAAVAPAQRVLA